MMRSRKTGPVTFALMLALAGAGLGCQREIARTEAVTPVATPAAQSQAQAQPAALRRVEVKKVCMINNTVFEKDQIPVEVEGKTYYGCCEMCKERLAKDEASRYATDPVSGAKVDKAKAVIGALPDGTTLYFENEANFGKYGQPKS